MVEFLSVMIGAVAIFALFVTVMSYLAAYLYGQRTISEGGTYINRRDVERFRGERVRDIEQKNTEASVQDHRPIPEVGNDE